MQTFPQPQSAQEEHHESRRTEDRIYQGVTIVAMLLLLVSLWVF
jgi:hypothetical protein